MLARRITHCAVHPVVLCALAGGMLSSSVAHAQPMSFTNTCGTGQWYTTCQTGVSQWSNNWGQTGTASFNVPFPGPTNTVTVAGSVTLPQDANVQSLTVPAGATLFHTGGTINTTAGFINGGTVDTTSAGNRWLVGPASTSGSWINGGAATYWFISPVSLTNSGSLTLSSDSVFQIWTGARPDAIFANTGGGTVSATTTGTSPGFIGLSLQSAGTARWLSSTGATLRLVNCDISGTFVGDFTGEATIDSLTTSGPATFTTVPASINGWNHTGGTINATAFPMTIGGKYASITPNNRWLKGTFTGLAGSSITIGSSGGNPPLWFQDAASLTTAGAITFAPGGAINRWTGAAGDHLLSVGGTLTATSTGHSIAGITVNGASGGSFATSPGAELNITDCNISGTFFGNHDGAATLTNVTAAGNTTLSTQPLKNAWNHRGTINANGFTITSAGKLDSVSNTNRWIKGAITSTANATLTVGGTVPMWFLDAATLTNAFGRVNLQGATMQRWNATPADHVFANQGTLAAQVSLSGSGSDNAINSITVTSTPSALWTTDVGTTFTFGGCLLSGTFRGDHAGNANLGSFDCIGNVTISNLNNTAWRWTSGSINSDTFTLTNLGNIDATGSVNRLLRGTAVNGPGATITTGTGIPFYFNQLAMTNNGSINLVDNGSISRWTGDTVTNTLVNNGAVSVSGVAGSTPGIVGVGLTNNGTITIGDGLTFAFTSSTVNQAAGDFRAGSGTTVSVVSPQITGGRWEMPGTIAGGGGTLSLSGGTLAPGLFGSTAAATLTLSQCRYNQSAGGTLEIGVVRNGGVQNVDQVNLTNGFSTATLGGTLRVTLPADQPPIGGVDYVIVNAPDGLTGTFANVTEANPIDGIRYDVRYTPTQAIMRVVRRCNVADVAGGNQTALYDGNATADDIIVFLGWFFAGDLRADFAGPNQSIGSDGLLTADDIIVFLGFYFQGCGF